MFANIYTDFSGKRVKKFEIGRELKFSKKFEILKNLKNPKKKLSNYKLIPVFNGSQFF